MSAGMRGVTIKGAAGLTIKGASRAVGMRGTTTEKARGAAGSRSKTSLWQKIIHRHHRGRIRAARSATEGGPMASGIETAIIEGAAGLTIKVKQIDVETGSGKTNQRTSKGGE